MIRLSVTEGLGNELDGIGGTAGDEHLVGIKTVLVSYHLLKRMGRWLGVGVYQVHVATQMRLQLGKIGIGVDITAEVHADARIAVDVVTVSVKHCPEGFGRVCPCRDASSHGRQASRIVVP